MANVQDKPKLTHSYRLFCEKFLETGNKTLSAIAAGYSEKNAPSYGARIYRRPEVQAYISAANYARAKRVQVTIDDVLKELKCLAFINPQDFYDDNGQLKNIKDMDPNVARAIKSIDVSQIKPMASLDSDGLKVLEESTKKIGMTDKLKALELIGKHLSMFSENININQKSEVKTINFHVIKSADEVPGKQEAIDVQYDF